MTKQRNIMWSAIGVAAASLCGFIVTLAGGNGNTTAAMSGGVAGNEQQPATVPARSASASESSQAYPKISPFINVRWDQDDPEILLTDYRGWVRLVAMDDIGVEQMISMCRAVDKLHWREEFTHNLIEVLMRNGFTFLDVTTIKARTLDSHSEITIPDVYLNEQNYRTCLANEAISQHVADDLAAKRQTNGR